MISLIVCCVLIASIHAKPVENKRDEDWGLDTGDGYYGVKYESPDGWNAGAQAHAGLGFLVDGGRLTGGYDFGNGLSLNGNIGGTFGNGGFNPSAGLGFTYSFGKRMATCIPLCYEECKDDKPCLEVCVIQKC